MILLLLLLAALILLGIGLLLIGGGFVLLLHLGAIAIVIVIMIAGYIWLINEAKKGRFLLIVPIAYLAALSAIASIIIVGGLISIAIHSLLLAGAGSALVLIGLFLFIVGLVLLAAGSVAAIPFLPAVGLILSAGGVVLSILGGIAPLAIFLLALATLGMIVLTILWSYLIFGYHRLPLSLIGLPNLNSIPAIPFRLIELPDTLSSLITKKDQRQTAINGLHLNSVTIAGTTQSAFNWMGMPDDGFFGPSRSDDPNTFARLDGPRQYSMSWTTFGNINNYASVPFPFTSATPVRPNVPPPGTHSATFLDVWANTLTDPLEATIQFWPTIANYAAAYNPFILQRMVPGDNTFKTLFGGAWSPQMDADQAAGILFFIDMRIFSTVGSHSTNGSLKFTPSTLTILRNEGGGVFIPIAIQVSGAGGTTPTNYIFTPGAPPGAPLPSTGFDPAWLYALQAAKTSISVWGIWIGHVYHFHIVTAAMQMTMYQLLPPLHPVRQILGYQSEHLIGFDEFMLLDWDITPPTSIFTSFEFLQLMDTFAATRPFFAGDPLAVLAANGLTTTGAEFTSAAGLPPPFNTNGLPPPFNGGTPAAFDMYPTAGILIKIFTDTRTYVTSVITFFYPGPTTAPNALIVGDAALQKWISDSANPSIGNVRGLLAPGTITITTSGELIAIVTSLLYRIAAHGIARMSQAADPAFTFVANFPPTLHSTAIPNPNDPVFFSRLLGPANPTANTVFLSDFLPNTGVIGEVINFFYTFVHTPPIEPFIPPGGVGAALPFIPPGTNVASGPNAALSAYRTSLIATMALYAGFSIGPDGRLVPGPPAQTNQWELNIET